MKNRLLLLILLMLMPCLLSAQGNSWTGHVGSTAAYLPGRSVVCAWGEHHLVEYYYDASAGLNFISLVDVDGFTSGTTITGGRYFMNLSSGVSFNDMCVVGDTLFFCGRTSSYCFYGWADLAGYPTINCGYTLVVGNISLNKLVVKNFGGTKKMWAIGENTSTYSDCIVASADVESNTAYELIDMGEREELDDVMLTDDYVVFVGRDTYADNIFLRRASVNTTLTGSTIHEKYTQGVAASSLTSTVHATHLLANEFALTYTGTDAYMHRCEVNATNITPLNSQRQPLGYAPTTDIASVAYIPSTDHLVVLWPVNTLLSWMVMFNPHTLINYPASELSWNEKVCSSLTALGDHAFAVWGSLGYGLQSTAVPLAGDSPYTCMRDATIAVYKLTLQGIAQGYEPLSVFVRPATTYPLGAVMMPAASIKTCEK